MALSELHRTFAEHPDAEIDLREGPLDRFTHGSVAVDGAALGEDMVAKIAASTELVAAEATIQERRIPGSPDRVHVSLVKGSQQLGSTTLPFENVRRITIRPSGITE